jgi:hypothetical protein
VSREQSKIAFLRGSFLSSRCQTRPMTIPHFVKYGHRFRGQGHVRKSQAVKLALRSSESLHFPFGFVGSRASATVLLAPTTEWTLPVRVTESVSEIHSSPWHSPRFFRFSDGLLVRIQLARLRGGPICESSYLAQRNLFTIFQNPHKGTFPPKESLQCGKTLK